MCRRRVVVVELQPPSSQPGEYARRLVRRKTASYERRDRQRSSAIIDNYNGGKCTVNSSCLLTSTSSVCRSAYVSYAQSSVRCRSTLPRRWSSHLCHHVWTTVTASWSESLTVWCGGCRQTRTPRHVWLPALADATTSLLFSSSFIGSFTLV